MTSARNGVLIVEDDDILRETLVEVVSDEGYEVRAAANGRVALATLGDWTPRVIILDLMMPQMDAFEFRHHQREARIAPEARILILSAARELGAAAERIGADGWIWKPFRLLEVIEAVDRLVNEPAA